MTTVQLIRENIPQHARILAALAELDDPLSALPQQHSLVNNLNSQLHESSMKVLTLRLAIPKMEEKREARGGLFGTSVARKITGRVREHATKRSQDDW